IKIASGRSDVIVAGGVESMSQMPLIYGEEMTEFFIELMKAKTLTQKMKVLTHFRLPHLAPVISIEQGLTDPFCGMNMGQTAEVLAREFGINREEQDQFALLSHQRAVKASEQGHFKAEILPLIYGTHRDKILQADIGPRANSSLESLAKLKPYFDRKAGTVTVGNSCPLTDGGSAILLCSAVALDRFRLTPIAKLVDYHFHGLEPERMGMGPLL